MTESEFKEGIKRLCERFGDRTYTKELLAEYWFLVQSMPSGWIEKKVTQWLTEKSAPQRHQFMEGIRIYKKSSMEGALAQSLEEMAENSANPSYARLCVETLKRKPQMTSQQWEEAMEYLKSVADRAEAEKGRRCSCRNGMVFVRDEFPSDWIPKRYEFLYACRCPLGQALRRESWYFPSDVSKENPYTLPFVPPGTRDIDGNLSFVLPEEKHIDGNLPYKED